MICDLRKAEHEGDSQSVSGSGSEDHSASFKPRLPKLQLPTLAGNVQEWPQF